MIQSVIISIWKNRKTVVENRNRPQKVSRPRKSHQIVSPLFDPPRHLLSRPGADIIKAAARPRKSTDEGA